MITVSLAGFQSYTQTDIAVVPNTIRRVNVTLTVGQITENVTVEASAAVLQTDRAEIRSEVTGNTLINLPVPIGRNYQLLMPTLPGVSDAQNASSFAANPTRSVNFSVNGTPTNINNFSIDGTNSRGVIDSTFTYIPALETVQEVTIVTNSFDAEQGLAGGAAIAFADQKRFQRRPRFSLRVPYRPAHEGVPVGRRPKPAQAEIHQQAVRRHHRRADQEGQAVLFPQLRGH